ncbi:type II secretion system protein M [Pectobacteriaceae bacterium CE70]|nr:type II secretion system protein M [Pectobacteriaceae bacterium C52]WJV65654.1 type II secretion system protein M [Pectobacteriaceae bacterium CE70]WJY09674.1 type II secretion system protein M [Pectobacteriaceae bacterium C80]
MNELRQRWQSMSLRERGLMLVCVGLVVLCLLYYLLWQPWQRQSQQWRRMIERERQTVSWMPKQAARLPTSRGLKPPVSGREVSLTVLIPQTAAQYGITIQRLQPQGNQVSVTLSRSDFNTLMRWLLELEQKNGVTTQVLDVAAVENSTGNVDVNRLLLERLKGG